MKIGTYAWMQQSHGRLSFKEKLTLIHQSMLPTLRSSLAMLLHPQQTACVVDFDQIVLPDSAIIRHAIEVLEEQQDLCLLHHSWRSYYWAAALAQISAQSFDVETLVCAALYHDIGLLKLQGNCEPQHCQCFTYASADYFEQHAERLSFDGDKTATVKDAICMHMNGFLDRSEAAEVQLLQLGTACDVVGQNYFKLAVQYRQQVHSSFPRQDFSQKFSKLLHDEAQQRPHARVALLRKLGLAQMIKLNPLDREVESARSREG